MRAARHTLSLQGHLLLRGGIGWELLVAGGVPVVAQDKRRQIRIGLGAELTRSVRRHRSAQHPEKDGSVARSPVPAKIAALEGWSSEFAVVQRRTVAILAIAAVRRLAAVSLRGCESYGLLLRDNGCCDPERECERWDESGKMSVHRVTLKFVVPLLACVISIEGVAKPA